MKKSWCRYFNFLGLRDTSTVRTVISRGGRKNIKTSFIFEICKVAAIMMSLETVRGCWNDGLAHSGNEDREVNVGLSGPSS